jgi:hypothetical protein
LSYLRLGFIFPITLIVSIPALFTHAQTISPSAKRDPEAISVLTKSIDALGEPPSAASVASCTVSGQATMFKGGVEVDSTASFTETDVMIDHSWDYTLHVVQGSHVKDVARQSGKLSLAKDGNSVTTPQTPPSSRPPFYLPALLLANAIADSSYSIVDFGTEIRAGIARRHVQITPWLKGKPELYLRQDWLFDKDQFLPIEVDYLVVAGSRVEAASPKRILFSGFKKQNGLSVAGILQYYSGAVLDEQRTVDTVSTDQQSNKTNSLVGGGSN